MTTTTRVALEGFHTVKHALRFGADVSGLITTDLEEVEELRRGLAPDLDLVAAGLEQVDEARWDEVVGRELPSPLFATAEQPTTDVGEVLARDGPVVLLERPSHLGNLGAVVRVAAAAGAAGVLTTGAADPWHPTAVRTAAGLHFAIGVCHTTVVAASAAARSAARGIVAIDGGPGAGNLPDAPPTRGDLLLLGTERHGLSDAALAAADRRVRIPMRAGVSSLNLATAAAVVLYAVSG